MVVRVLSWNVNGLRAVLRRCNTSLLEFLQNLGADIVCFQETKLTRNELLLDRQLSLAEGWESFFSCTQGKTGYSGVATFCKATVTVPNSAEEGFTGLLTLPNSVTQRPPLLDTLTQRFGHDELLEMDAEGRCVITDHGEFVLFNVYAPAIANAERAEERFAFKLKLFEVLFMRMDELRQQGRRTVLVGDLNIAPAPVDSCDPGTGADLAAWIARADRALLRSRLQLLGGPYVDIFRLFHPHRREAYTCWNQASSARVNNYGTRIDLILLADAVRQHAGRRPFEACWVASDIEPGRQGSDHAPVWADLEPHQPLVIAAAPPPLASRFLFAGGKQQTLASWLGSTRAASQPDAFLPGTHSLPKSSFVDHAAASSSIPHIGKACNSDTDIPSQNASAHFNTDKPAQLSQARPSMARAAAQPADVFRDAAVHGVSNKRGPASAVVAGSKRAKHAQISMRQFLAPSGSGAAPAAQAACPAGSGGSGALDANQQSTSATLPSLRSRDSDVQLEPAQVPAPVPFADQCTLGSPAALCTQEPNAAEKGIPGHALPGDAASKPAAMVDRATAAAAWQQIHQKMKPPKCAGHKEDCVIREVKKAGPNKGRLFYVCARPDGPKPQGRCDHFQWVGDRKIRGPT